MSAKKQLAVAGIILSCALPIAAQADIALNSVDAYSLALALGWRVDSDSLCGGYFWDDPYTYHANAPNDTRIQITSLQGLFAARNTSYLEKNVTITRYGQQITADKGTLYRNPVTFKPSHMDLSGNIHLREPNTLVLGDKAHDEFESNHKEIENIAYRSTLVAKKVAGPGRVSASDRQCERKLTSINAWGQASLFASNAPEVYDLYDASFSTCTPTDPAWQIRAQHINLNQQSGRGYATHARFYIHGVPVLYTPYISFSTDKQRKTGFLWPTIGLANNKWGPYIFTPFYWNMAPNYDMVIIPGYMGKRGAEITDKFRYLSHVGRGRMGGSLIPHDNYFVYQQRKAQSNPQAVNAPAGQNPQITDAELNRLLTASATRGSVYWVDKSRYNPYWSSFIDFTYVSDDYYLRDFGDNLNDVTANQLLQEADVYYSGAHWYFTGRLQGYQTLHPVDQNVVYNQYRRIPQLILSADYPDQAYGLDYFMNSELANFDILKDPGCDTLKPIGTRTHFQPGVSWPIYTPALYFNPRLQVALTDYYLHQTQDTPGHQHITRAIPIFDLATGLSFVRQTYFAGYDFTQTLEPQFYYTYIPYHQQNNIPVFDTTVNTLVYDQLFNYNRFSGLDRIGDANQVSIGLSSRLIDQASGFEKIRFGIGEIIYFANRRVTLCNDQSCTDNPNNVNNRRPVSPLSLFVNYHLFPYWTAQNNVLWNPITKQLDNVTFTLHYQSDALHIFNFSYSFAQNNDILSGIVVNNGKNNLVVTDTSFVWPLTERTSIVGRYSRDWHADHFQNLLYGLQYDTCCWAMRLVGGKTFTNAVNVNRPQYRSTFFIQFDLKGLGNIGRDPSKLLSSISGYNTQFGQEI